ncbi:DEAD/DEAH box helicase family protein [Ferrovibrio sp.]|uniref:DEAD/DEAH box helicase family protein n=1 Tax=Ferrovibrio sp. TaxID=1917215 RepID=UPI000CA901CD|nr:DEAD/DEAH box helicase family protein [Ferrovibrio sp.]PJI42550.1 MAG: type III restriction endonuclease subunit R [Ferrovibrio sp.]
MALHPDFPIDPYAVLHPDIRWYPGDEMLGGMGYAMLLPPLVYKIRKAVAEWRASGYLGGSPTTVALLNHWFRAEHMMPQADGTVRPFQWYFAQREAVESALWLYEVERARDPYALMKFDSSSRVSKGMFAEDWTRYVLKLATGAGKTKVMSLLMTWSYFHKLYEPDSDLSTNFLLIAPNIIVLDRLRTDFDGARIFYEDPLLPGNGYEGQNWRDDFQMTVHIQDGIGLVEPQGNLFLTNIHRVYESGSEPALEDENVTDYFLGKKPAGKTMESQVDLGVIVREVPDLVVLNDEAHHLHDVQSAWFKAIEDIALRLRQKGSELSAQFDLSATPKHNNGAIFVQTIADYPLVEAIRQGVVKTPVLPDGPSRAKLQEKKSAKYTEQYEDYLHLGYLEWKKVYDELLPTGRKSVLFIMTDDTRNCDEVAEYLEGRYPELKGGILVIHTKRNGEISEASSGKSKEELNELREASRSIDDPTSPYKAIVSVMVLREGWDVQNVVSIVGLRPFTSTARILPEQTLGRGLRRMFRGQDLQEKVSVIGTDAFMDFVEGIKVEGVELEYQPMGGNSGPKSPVVIEVDQENKNKDIDRLDIDLPLLAPRIHREYKSLTDLDIAALGHARVSHRMFTEDEQREIIFRDMNTDEQSHVTAMDTIFTPNYQNMIGFFARSIMRDLRLVGGFDILFGKLKEFIESHLFNRAVDLNDLNTLRNLSEIDAARTLVETIKTAVNALTVRDAGTTEVRGSIRISKTRPYLVKEQAFLVPKKSLFNKVVGDSHFELEFAAFLDNCSDIVSFIKNSQSTSFRIEYQNADGGIANYIPDFVVNQDGARIWIIETKGREDLDDPLKWERLQQWCADATTYNGVGRAFSPLFVRQEAWEKHKPKSLKDLIAATA